MVATWIFMSLTLKHDLIHPAIERELSPGAARFAFTIRMNKAKADGIIRIVWFLGCIITGTMVGVLIGGRHYGWLGAIGVGLLGFIIGGIFGAAPGLLAEFVGAALSR
jgi:hypothetical protein